MEEKSSAMIPGTSNRTAKIFNKFISIERIKQRDFKSFQSRPFEQTEVFSRKTDSKSIIGETMFLSFMFFKEQVAQQRR